MTICPPLFKYLVPTFILLSFIVACHSEKSANQKDLTRTSAEDSIDIWIDRSRDPDLSEEDRDHWLEKAENQSLSIKQDSVKLVTLSKVSLAYLRNKDSLKFRQTNKLIMSLALRTKDSTQLAIAHWDMATFFRDLDVKDSAYYHYGEAQKIYHWLGDDFMEGRMLLQIARVQTDIKDYVGSEINSVKALELLKPLEKNYQIYACYTNLGIVSRGLGEYKRAVDYYNTAYTYQKENDSTLRNYRLLQNNIGNVHKDQGEYAKAISYFRESLKDEVLLTDNPADYATRMNNLAYSRFKTGDTVNVFNELTTALKISEEANAVYEQSYTQYNLAEFHLSFNDTIEAYDYAMNAVKLGKRSANNDRLLETYELLARINPDEAVTYAEAYINLNDSLQMQERKIRDKFARIQFETDEFIAENVSLARQRQLWIGIATGLFLLAIAIFIIIDQRSKNQKLKFERQQQEANQEIFDLMLSTSQKVEEGKHNEQKRISEELHDGVLGQMNGVRMVLLGLNKKSDENSVAMRSEAIEKLQDVQEEIRTISHELSDAAYQKFHNFIVSIRDLVDSVSQASEIACEFTYDHDTEWDELSGEVKINLYRIVQEGLQNCVKYSDANLIKLNFGTAKSELQITLEDDGVGFDAKKVKKGIGHKNISSRINKIGGQWQVESTPGKGTKIRITVPYVRSLGQRSSEEEHVLEKETLDK